MVERKVTYHNFPEKGLVWGLHREVYAGVLASQLAFLTQAAHQGATNGFLDHSTLLDKPARRILETMLVMDTITYGTQEATKPLLDGISAMHQHVAKKDSNNMTEHAMLWVGLSYIYALAKANSTFLHAMTPRQLDTYYTSARDGFLPLFGVDPEKAPGTYEGLESWMREELQSGRVGVNQRARDVIAPIVFFQEPISFPQDILPDALSKIPGVSAAWGKFTSQPRTLDKVTYPLRKATTGLLFPELREGYGLSWNRLDEVAFRAAAFGSRLGYPVASDFIPPALRFTGGYRRAQMS